MMPDRDSAWLRRERTKRGWSTKETADRARSIAHSQGSALKLTQQSISGFETRSPKRHPEWLRYVVAAFLAHDRLAEAGHGDDQSEQPATRSVDSGEIVTITRLDLSLPMGPGALVDDYVEDEPVAFDMAYVRSFTRTAPHRLRLAGGAGDSMFPTLMPNDLVWIDTTQNDLRHVDRIYAASIDGGAAIKRLRPVDGGKRVLVISDNKIVEPYSVAAENVRIWGRVIRFARDL